MSLLLQLTPIQINCSNYLQPSGVYSEKSDCLVLHKNLAFYSNLV